MRLPLLRCGYRFCGRESLTGFLPIAIPLVEKLNDQLEEQNNALVITHAYDLAIAYEMTGRTDEAKGVTKRLALTFASIGKRVKGGYLDIAKKVDERLIDAGLYARAAILRKGIRGRETEICLSEAGNDREALFAKLEELRKRYRNSCSYRDMVDVCRKTWELRKETFDGDEEAVLDAASWYGYALSTIGDVEAALPLDERVLARRREQPDCDTEQLAGALGNVAYSLERLGRRDEAVRLRSEAVSLREKQYGEDHYKTLRAKRWLAGAMGLTPQAKDMLEDVRDRFARQYGEDDWDTLLTQEYLAWNAYCSDRYEEAREQYAQLLPEMRKVLGEIDWRTLDAAWHELSAMWLAGYRDEAREKLDALIPLIDCAFGEDSPEAKRARDAKKAIETSYGAAKKKDTPAARDTQTK